ncbi:TIGR04282 family arsenosugar biosynthesis glycosyltransferase [Segetibacter sp.]|jgi:rSAM/selenodomain-associated transferase 1|uniref:TIGR04282 family arsenosugar biosynthesis glycosyltransferase n=1 Tax=Segetibacter sp. TaxID=2231182 RepID=UPI00260F678D|nr:TIGR04282 family arsenosugar biosynthesis glycosyltransferase [Segetibacter sp.]MCW3080706.1 glycosyltransferase [Segetibacter sp.]
MENALIIFVRNTEKGKVKSRLAKDLGDDKTLDIYKFLLRHTRDVAISCNCSHFVFYSSYVHINDIFDDDLFTKFVQEGENLGERMINAFKKVFDLGCKKVCIIGSDCYELQTEILVEAFKKLQIDDVVIGPASDGGYYLLGVKQLNEDLLAQKQWGTSSVLDDTMASIKEAGLSYAELAVLNDIDTIDDLLQTNILTWLKEDTSGQ